ncbi:DNA replication complex GINS protein PSF2 [Lecanicillium sp. MT-2017a]|nr:DNA replication complex GINS protein PSF2 [Lecanicillium sp. MT-2017a]
MTDKKSVSPPIGSLPNPGFQGLLMTSFALPERPRSRRAKYPKVRTGCVSCK